MALTQGLFKRFMKLFGADVFPLLEVLLHEFLIEFNHLVNDIDVRLSDGQEVGFPAFRLEKTVYDFSPAAGR